MIIDIYLFCNDTVDVEETCLSDHLLKQRKEKGKCDTLLLDIEVLSLSGYHMFLLGDISSHVSGVNLNSFRLFRREYDCNVVEPNGSFHTIDKRGPDVITFVLNYSFLSLLNGQPFCF